MKSIVVSQSKKKKNLFKLHQISQKWLVDLAFLHDEQVFLRDLISKFFMELCSVELFANTNELTKSIKRLNIDGNELISEIQLHEKQLAILIESTQSNRERSFRKAHKKLAKQYEAYVEKNRDVKKRIFTIVKQILKKHKQKKLKPHVIHLKEDNPTLSD